MKKIDLRSDTVTLPSPEMRQAMMTAELGDDVFGEDPTVRRLEEMAASLTGKQAALFVASGTMGNLAAVLSHCGRGDEAILGSKAHIHIHEQGGIAALGGVHSRVVSTRADGTMDIAALEAVINDDDIHCAPTKLICLENTWYGRVLPLVYMQEVKELAQSANLAVHLDGARIFNAAVALETSAAAIAQYADSVQFCLSKSLGSPVGSVLCGGSEFIARARRARKQLGGGMRQAGILAAAGIYSLKHMVERLKDDHRNAAVFAACLHKVDGVKVLHAETNMVFIAPAIPGVSMRRFCQELNAGGLLAFAEEYLGIRCVTHFGIEESDLRQAAEIVQSVCRKLLAARGQLPY
jgi:threonine aldolase